MPNWYTAKQAAALFRPPLTDKTVRTHVRTVRKGSSEYADKVRMDFRDGKQVQTVSEAFCVQLASKTDRIFVSASEQVRGQTSPFEQGEGAVDGPNRVSKSRAGSDPSATAAAAVFERLLSEKDARIALLETQLTREKETADREREIARESQAAAKEAAKSLHQEQRLRMAAQLGEIIPPPHIADSIGPFQITPDAPHTNAKIAQDKVPARKWFAAWLSRFFGG